MNTTFRAPTFPSEHAARSPASPRPWPPFFLPRKKKATHFINSTAENVGEALKALGGAKIVLSTAPSAAAAGACIDGASLFDVLYRRWIGRQHIPRGRGFLLVPSSPWTKYHLIILCNQRRVECLLRLFFCFFCRNFLFCFETVPKFVFRAPRYKKERH